jgi:hypothetical protein
VPFSFSLSSLSYSISPTISSPHHPSPSLAPHIPHLPVVHLQIPLPPSHIIHHCFNIKIRLDGKDNCIELVQLAGVCVGDDNSEDQEQSSGSTSLGTL